MDGFRRMLWVGRQHSADHIPVSALQLVTCRWFKAERAKSKEQERATLFQSAAQPGAQGDAGLCFGLFSPSFVRPRPLALALGAFKNEQERVGRAGSPGNFRPQLLRPVWHGCRLAFRGIGPGR